MAAPTLRVLGTGTSNPTATTAINPTVGTGATSTDISILSVAMKPYSTTITTPSGWTKIGEWTNGTVASAADVGSTKLAMYYRIGAPVGAIGNLTFSGADTAAAGIATFQNTTGQWDVANVVSAADTTDGTSYSVTAASGIDVNSASDIVFVAHAMNSDTGTLSATTFVGMAGATQQTQSGAFNAVNSQGNDCRLYARYVNFSAGSSNAAPGMTITSTSAMSGTAAFLRIREATANTVTGAVTFGAGSAAGAAAFQGSATGALTFIGAASGARASAGSATGAVAFVGTATGGVPRQGSVSGTVSWVGTATGASPRNGTVTGAVSWAGTAVGTRAAAFWSEGLLADWDADDLQGADGAAVSTWTDKVGSFAANQGTGTAQPTLRDRSHGLNSHQVLEFDGTTDWMALPAGARALAQNAATLDVFVVMTMPSGAVTGTRTVFSLSTGTSTASARVSVQARNASGFPAAAGRRLDADASVAQAAGTVALSNPYAGVLTARYLWNSSDAYIYQDGTQIGSNLSFQTTGTTDNTVSLNGAIGARPEGTIERHNGTIARVLVFPDLSVARRALVHSYLATRYGLTVSDYVNTGAGQVLGTVTFTGAATGKRTPKGTAAGTVSWVGSAAGTHTNSGSVAGAVTWTGSVAGKRTPKGSVSGAVAWTGASAGAAAYEGSATGEVSWTGFAVSGGQNFGAATGAVDWTGSATGVSAQTGSATGTFTFTGSADGTAGQTGEASGEVTWTGTAVGTAPAVADSVGAAFGEVTWSGTATGEAPVAGHYGTAEGTVSWAGSAVGPHRPMGPWHLGRPLAGGPAVGQPEAGGPRIGRPRGALVTVGWPRKESDG